MSADTRFPREAGFVSKIKTATLSAIKDSNPSHCETGKGNEGYRFVVKFEHAGETWGSTFTLTRYGSRFDGMSEAEADQAKQLEKLASIPADVLKAAIKAQSGK